MNSLILSTTTRMMFPLLLLFSVFLLLRGHNDPGGGFVGGLVAAASYSLYAMAFGVAEARRVLRVDPRGLIGVGLLVALGSGVAPLLAGRPFLTGMWGKVGWDGIGTVDLGTPLVFDVGVYLVVIGVTLLVILSLAEE